LIMLKAADLLMLAAFNEDAEKWRELREFWYGRPSGPMDRTFALLYPQAWAAGRIHPTSINILRRFADETAPALVEPPEVLGKPGAIEWLWQQYETLNDAWQIRRIGCASWLHFAVRRGRPELELVLGDQLVPDADPADKRNLQSCRQLGLTVDGGLYVYSRSPSGAVQARTLKHNELETAAAYPFRSTSYPLLGFYRDSVDRVVPLLDTDALEGQRTANVQLTDAEHHRRYLPGQPWLRSDQRERNEVEAMPTDPAVLLHLEPGEDYGIQAPGGDLDKQLEHMGGTLRLRCLFAGLSPETFDPHSRAETGAAKAADFAPNYRTAVRDWFECSRAMRRFVAWVSPFLEQCGVDPAGLAVLPREPRPPADADPQAREQARQARQDLGLETSREQVQAERRVPPALAREIVEVNMRELARRKRIETTGEYEPPDPEVVAFEARLLENTATGLPGAELPGGGAPGTPAIDASRLAGHGAPGSPGGRAGLEAGDEPPDDEPPAAE